MLQYYAIWDVPFYAAVQCSTCRALTVHAKGGGQSVSGAVIVCCAGCVVTQGLMSVAVLSLVSG